MLNVLESDLKNLPAQRNRSNESLDIREYRIDVEYYDNVGTDVFRELK